MNSGMTLHLETLYGTNDHHIADRASKVWRGRYRRRFTIDARAAEDGVPSTKVRSAVDSASRRDVRREGR